MAKSARASSPDLFSISAASDALGRSRRTITKALANVKPAKIVSGLKLWHMRDVIEAINNNTQAPLLNDGGSSSHSGYAAEFQADCKVFDVGFATLEAEPDLERRRALNEKLGVGQMIGALDRKMKEQNAAMGEADGCIQFVCDHLIGRMISNFLTLMDYWPSDEEMEQMRVEGNAIKPWPAHIQREIDAR